MSANDFGDRARLVRLTGLVLAVTFAAVGVVFLVLPGRVLALFNEVGDVLGLPASPTDAYTLFLALAVAYMYVVTLLAWRMARRPHESAYPWLLVHAKAASALVCVILFVAQDQYFVFAANAVVDGLIALVVWGLALRGLSGDQVVSSRDASPRSVPYHDAPSSDAPVSDVVLRAVSLRDVSLRAVASGTRDGFALRG